MTPSPASIQTEDRRFAGAPVSSWAMLGMASLAMALTAPGQTAAISVFIDPMLSELGIGRTAISVSYLVGTLVGAAAMPWTGRAIDRFGVRRVMVPVALAFGAALLAFSLVESIWSVTVGFLAVRLLGQGALTLITTTAVALAFDRRRGAALGIVLALGSVGISLAPLLLEQLIAAFGWRGVWVVEGLVIWAVLLPIALGIRVPRLVGGPRTPDEAVGNDAATASGRPPGAWGLTRAEALRSPFFWLVTASVGSAALLTTAVAFHQIDLLGERGLGPGAAAANFLPQTFAGLLATVLMGLLSDRVAARWLIATATGLLAVSLVMGTVVAPGWSSIAFGALIGFGAGSIRALEATTLPRYFGVRHIGSIRGVVMGVGVAGSAFGPIFFALGRETLGSYAPTLMAGALIPVALTLAALVIEPPRRLDRALQMVDRSGGASVGEPEARPTGGTASSRAEARDTA